MKTTKTGILSAHGEYVVTVTDIGGSIEVVVNNSDAVTFSDKAAARLWALSKIEESQNESILYAFVLGMLV